MWESNVKFISLNSEILIYSDAELCRTKFIDLELIENSVGLIVLEKDLNSSIDQYRNSFFLNEKTNIFGLRLLSAT